MQAAARKVLDENKKLRALLKSKGVSDDDIETLMAEDQMSDEAAPTGFLDSLLHTKKPCCPGDSTDCSSMGASPQPPSSSSKGLHPDIASMSLGSISVSPRPFISPSIAPSEDLAFPHTAYQFSTQSSGASQTATAYPYNFHMDPYWQTYPIGGLNTSDNNVQSSATTSCIDAANIIRTVGGNVGTDLEADLGCLQPGTDCKVDNATVLDVMEKYASQGPWR